MKEGGLVGEWVDRLVNEWVYCKDGWDGRWMGGGWL